MKKINLSETATNRIIVESKISQQKFLMKLLITKKNKVAKIYLYKVKKVM